MNHRGHVEVKYHHFETMTQNYSSELSHTDLLWKQKLFADITFVVQDQEILAHRAILLKSRYFQNMFKSGMIEATSTKINVPGDISAQNFRAILEYIYYDTITLTQTLALDLVVLADMYFLAKLKADCENYLSKNLSVESFLSVLNVAEMADSSILKKRVVKFFVENLEKVNEEVDIQKIPSEFFIKALLYQRENKNNK